MPRFFIPAGFRMTSWCIDVFLNEYSEGRFSDYIAVYRTGVYNPDWRVAALFAMVIINMEKTTIKSFYGLFFNLVLEQRLTI